MMIPFEYVRPIARDRSPLSADNLDTLYGACRAVETLPGNVVELSSGKGGSAMFMAKCLPNKTVWMFDLESDIPSDIMNYVDIPFDQADLRGEKLCLVHLVHPTSGQIKTGLRSFWPKLVVGGRVLIYFPPESASIAEFLGLFPGGTNRVQHIQIPASADYFLIEKLADVPTDFDGGLVPRAEGDTTPLEAGPTPEGMTAEPVAVEDLQPTEIPGVLVESDIAGTGEAICLGGLEYAPDAVPLPEPLRKVEILRQDESWTEVPSLLQVINGNIFRMLESDGEILGPYLATGDGYTNAEGQPAIECRDVPRVKGAKSPVDLLAAGEINLGNDDPSMKRKDQ
jgi:hypothetical protein